VSNYPNTPGFVAGSDTSEEAAVLIEEHAPSMRTRALRILRENPNGLTNDEVQRLTGWLHQSTTARMRELVLMGLAYNTPDRRPTRTGRNAVVRRAVSRP
jgi:hypothetical protein